MRNFLKRPLEVVKRRSAQLVLLLAGIAAGSVVAVTVVSTSDSMLREDPAGRETAPVLPDYAATIRAPTPTPGGTTAQRNRVELEIDDIAEFRLHSRARATQEAIAIAASVDPERLMRIVAQTEPLEACFEEMADAMSELPLLPETLPHAEDAASCVIRALRESPQPEHPYVAASQERRAEKVHAFLSRYGASLDPFTRAAAELPSPRNMSLWRNTREARLGCYAALPGSARRVGSVSDPSAASDQLHREAQKLLDCFAGIADDLPRAAP